MILEDTNGDGVADTSSIKSITDLKVSMMPEALYRFMSAEELADLLEYFKG